MALFLGRSLAQGVQAIQGFSRERAVDTQPWAVDLEGRLGVVVPGGLELQPGLDAVVDEEEADELQRPDLEDGDRSRSLGLPDVGGDDAAGLRAGHELPARPR